MSTEARAEIGVTGLSVMGRNLARNLARNGFSVALHNRSVARTNSLVADHGDEGDFVPSESMADFVASLKRPRAVIIMVKAGKATDAVIDELVPLLEKDDIVIDAGNAHFVDTARRERRPLREGAALRRHRRLRWRGGRAARAEHHAGRVRGVLPQARSDLREDRRAGRRHAVLRPRRSGRRRGTSSRWCTTASSTPTCSSSPRRTTCSVRVWVPSPAEIAEIFREWNSGDLDSFLIEITAEVLAHTDGETGQPFIDVVLDRAEQKGTGRWTVQSALDLGVPITGIAEATFARSLSGHVEQREAARRAYEGKAADTDIAGLVDDRKQFIEDVRNALYASKIVAYAQGFDHIRAGSNDNDWDIDPGAMATIWRGGCIIRAKFLDRIREAYAENPDLKSLLVAPYFAEAVTNGVDELAPRRGPPRSAAACRPRPSPRRWPTSTRCAAPGCPPR